MAQKTNLNVAPYYDDFEASDNFNRVLFRPGFAIQARELTQLQSALQNQIEKHGSHIFKEGAMVIPGQISLNTNYYSLKLASTFGGETIDPSQYYNATTPVTITGATSGVTARVIGFDVATTTDQPTLYVQYVKTGSDNATAFFSDGENISANTGITHTTAYSSGAASSTTFTSDFTLDVSTKANLISSTGPAAATGSAVHIEAGTYYIRGNFVECAAETLVLDKYNNQPSYRVGFTVTESLVTPESDSTLLDNATGSSNFAAKGAHRLKISLALAKLDRDSTADGSFVQLLDTKQGNIQSITRVTEYEILEDTLARRTFDESGNYTVRPFQLQMKESVTVNEFEGTYSTGAATDDNNTASDNLLVAQVSTGKAYVKGYELDKISPTFKDVLKARDFDTINAGQTLVNTGNFALINNVYGQPEISPISGETTSYKDIILTSNTNTSASASSPDIKYNENSGTTVGLARARAFEHSTGTIGTDDAQYKLFLFDIKMITYIGVSHQTSITDGAQIIGQTSGATGRVLLNSDLSDTDANTTITDGIRIALTDVVGRFQVGEKLKSSDSGQADQLLHVAVDSNSDVTVTSYNGSVQTDFKFEDVRGVFQNSTSDTTAQNFQGSIVLQSPARRARQINGLVIDGTDAGGANANSLLGQGETGDDNANSGGLNLEDIKTARLNDADKNNALEKLPKQVIKTLLTATNDGVTDTQFTIRRQFVGSTNSSGAITFNAGSNETFVSHSEKDYVLSILTAGGGTGSAGQLVSVASTISGVGGTSITITDSTVLGNAAKVRLTATLLKTSVVAKSKTTRLMKQINVINTSLSATNFGTRVGDAEISLGRVDAFKMVGVFDSQDSSTNASAPELTLGTITGAFTRGEKITGSSSGATARIIDTTSPMSFVSTNDKTFTTSDTISGESSSATAAVSAVTTGSPVITSSFVLDTGQRDNYYDISRIVRKKGSAAPIGRLLVVYDYLEHGAGDVFTVDSYSDVAKQMEYVDIPNFTASKVDPDEPIPSGDFPLTDTYDSRPAVDSATGMTESVSSVDTISGKSFDFFSRSFGGTGGTTVDTLKPGSFIQSDFEFYLPRISTITLSKEGDFTVRDGQSAEVPQPPKVDDDSMLIATLKIPPFTFEPDSVEIIRAKHQRYTMKDIGKLENRIDHLEYYTSLTLLERDAESFEVTDAQGLNRFKSGFMVDNFKGHRTGDTIHKDYKCAMDFEAGELRPQHRSKAVSLSELASSDSERTSLGYQKTGDLITLPYTEEVLTTQPYATQLERVTPYLTSSWIGRITLSPSGDTWFETEVAAQLVVNREGDYDAVLARERNNLGTIWNSWQTTWSGVVDSRAEVELFDRTETSVTRAGSGVRRFRRTRTTETVRTNQRRVGVNTEVTLRIDRESQGFRTIGRAAIPIMRSNTITFTGEGFKPNTRIYPFFNKVAVSNNVTPSSGFSSDSTIVAGSPLITNSTGQIGGTFVIPDPKVAGNPQFPTGDIEFRLTSSSTNGNVNARTAVGTAGATLYHANGFLETIQETIISTRNADVTRRSLNQSRSNTSNSVVSDRTEDLGIISWADPPRPPTPPVITSPDEGSGDTEGGAPDGGDDGEGDDGDDPLAMTFMVEPNAETSGRPTSGRFITSVDIFHGEKDDTLPVTVELRNTVNGYPGPKVLPFARVTKQVADINISSTAATATTYTFPSPVYVETDKEYCIVVLSNVPTHKVWISRMGEVDVGGTRTVSEQPHTGVLFKGHNNRAWAMSPTEDLKFTIKCAKFDTSAAGNVTLENDAVPNVTLARDPLTFSHGSNVIKVNHPDHHMYSTANNVTIDNVKSGASTTLNGAITASSTSITLTSGTNFDDTSGKFSRTSSSTYFIKIDDEIISYTTISGNVISGAQRGQGSTTAATHADGSTVELYQAWTIPFTEIIKTHTAIANIGIDSYTISTTASASVGSTGDDVNVGGTAVTATENALMDYFQTLIGSLELPETSITSTATLTSGTSPDGTQSSFTSGRTAPNTVPVITYPLNDNFKFEQPRLIASSINETNELSSLKSYSTTLKLSSDSTALSPVIDTERATVFAIANRINNIDSSSDVYPTTSFVPSTEPEGDQNAAIYLTKQVTLAASATSLKVILAAHRPATSEIKVLFKTLGVDESIDFQAKGFTFFNDDGSSDTTVQPSSDRFDFQEYVFTAGVTDDGIGDQLPEFVAFQVKIIMQGTNCAEPPRLRDLRVLALGT